MITINGEQHTLEQELVLLSLLEQACGSNLEGIAVAINGALIPRSAWPNTTLESGDDVEIVQATSGG